MTVRVLEVTRLSTPKGLPHGFQQARASGDCLAHDSIDFTFTANVMAECRPSVNSVGLLPVVAMSASGAMSERGKKRA